jgi:hypothetical protein
MDREYIKQIYKALKSKYSRDNLDFNKILIKAINTILIQLDDELVKLTVELKQLEEYKDQLQKGSYKKIISNPTDVLIGNEVKCVCGEIFANNTQPRQVVFTLACDLKVDPCYKCKKQICIYCGDEVIGNSVNGTGEYSAHNEDGVEPTVGSYNAHFGWALFHNRPENGGSWPTTNGWCLKRPDVVKYKSSIPNDDELFRNHLLEYAKQLDKEILIKNQKLIEINKK